MKLDFKLILLTTLLVFSFLALIQRLTVLYFLITDSYFLNRKYKNEFDIEHNYEFLLYIKLIPIIFLLVLGYWIKKNLHMSWLDFILAAILALIAFRFGDLYINAIFSITHITVFNICVAIICYSLIQLSIFFKVLKNKA